MKARNKFSKRVAVIAPFLDDGRTQQHFADQVNINNILAKYRKTGIIEHVKRAEARFGSFPDMNATAADFDKVAKAKQSFEMLPAELRNKFNNNIPEFFEFLHDPDNRDQLTKWGFFNKKEGPETGTPVSAKPAEPAPGSKKDGSPKKAQKIADDSGGED